MSDAKKNRLWRFLTKKRYIYKPYLDVYLDIGLITFRTSVMRQAIERNTYEYIRLEWRIYKWDGGFNLYKPGRNMG